MNKKITNADELLKQIEQLIARERPRAEWRPVEVPQWLLESLLGLSPIIGRRVRPAIVKYARTGKITPLGGRSAAAFVIAKAAIDHLQEERYR